MSKFSSFARSLARRKWIAIAIAIVVVACIILLLSQRKPSTPAAAKQVAALTVTVATATQAQWPDTLDASGAIEAWQEAVIGAQVSGLRLADVRFNVGDRVKRGQVLAVFDADLLRADEARLKATWQQAEANRLRAVQLKGTGGISEQEILQYVTQAETAKAQLRSIQLQLRYAEITAPDDGVISARSATLGAVSNSGQELFRLIRQNRLEWRGELTVAQLAKIEIGQGIGLMLPNGNTANAKVRQMAPSLNGQTRLGIVYADIAPGSTARAGMYAKGSIVLSESPAITVPAASVVIRDGHSYVPVLADGDRVRLNAVSVGRRQGTAVEVTTGVAIGDKVVVHGAGFLNDGDVVRLATTAKD